MRSFEYDAFPIFQRHYIIIQRQILENVTR